MGGHGGLYLGFRHVDFFGACGSMSGALSIESLAGRYEISKVLGDTADKKRYHSYSIFNKMEQLPTHPLAIIIDCGTSDQFITMNRKAHEKMNQLKIPHDYIERPGGHDWKYWANAVEYQLLFFRKYFNESYAL
jgi:S-formylglutathione hydrolase FrmB